MLAMFSPIEAAVVLAVGGVPYFVPTIIAAARHKQNTGDGPRLDRLSSVGAVAGQAAGGRYDCAWLSR